MTWRAASRRWVKEYGGKTYARSCRQLGCEGTKEGSWQAANAWWEKTVAGLEDARREPTAEEKSAAAFTVYAGVKNWDALDTDTRRTFLDGILGAGEYDRIYRRAESVADSMLGQMQTPGDKGVSAQLDRWYASLMSKVSAGVMSPGRYQSYTQHGRIFLAWIGDVSVECIDERKVEGYYAFLSLQVGAQKYSPAYARLAMMTAQQFVSWMAGHRTITAPANLRSKDFRFGASRPKPIKTYTIPEVRAILAACDGHSERTKLYLLLMLNCGMYQSDVSDLLDDEVDWKAGTITRARSKTGSVVVCYRLWPETLALLKRHRSKTGGRVLTTDEGKQLCRQWIEGGESRRYDVVQSAWLRLRERAGKQTLRLPMKHLRKTGATILGTHKQYKFYGVHYLADSPRGMAAIHYQTPSQDEFDEAIAWLRTELLVKEGV